MIETCSIPSRLRIYSIKGFNKIPLFWSIKNGISSFFEFIKQLQAAGVMQPEAILFINILMAVTNYEYRKSTRFFRIINDIPMVLKETIYYIRSYLVLIIISIIGATALIKNMINKIRGTKFKIIIEILEPVTYLILLTLCTAYLIDASFNPFLYFRF